MSTSEKPHILVTAPWYQAAMDELPNFFTVHRLDTASDPEALLAEVKDKVVGLAGSHDMKINGALMDKLPNLKVVSNFGVGYDNVDVEAATAHGLKVGNTPDVLNDCVADLALGLVLATCRKIPQADRYVRDGKWESVGNMAFTTRVHHRKVGILGLGRIGQEIADRCAGFKMEIGYHTRSKRDVPYTYYASLLEMAREVEILIAIVPGGAATKHIINREILDALGPQGVLINVARGSVVDEQALIEALRDGRLGAAGLDVFEAEPKVPQALRDLSDRTVLQPHQASATHDTRMAMGRMVIDNLRAAIEGRPMPSQVN